MPHVDLETYIDHRRHTWHGARLAFEMSGCIRSLNLTMESKLAAVRLLRAAGWRVDLFCALEACGDSLGRGANDAEGQLVDTFASRFRAPGEPAVVDCRWWRHGQPPSVLYMNQTLRAEYRAEHPAWPYPRHGKGLAVMNTLEQFHKFAVVREMRAAAEEKHGHRYAYIWRNRPDFVSLNLTNSLLSGPRGHAAESTTVVVPACSGGAHTDIEALVPTAAGAAEHYASIFNATPALYRSGLPLSAEQFMDVHMVRGGFRYEVAPGATLYRCATECFGATRPCRLMPAHLSCGSREGNASRVQTPRP
jgi:hypothetical protein